LGGRCDGAPEHKLAKARSRKVKTLEVVRHSGSVASGQEIEVARLTREPNEAHELLLVNPK